MLDKLTAWIENHLAESMARIANQRHLRAVQDGTIATLPLIIVGSFFLIIAFPPLPEPWGITQFLTNNVTTILLPYRMTMCIMALYATFGVGAGLAKSYNLDQVSGGILATVALLLTLVLVAIPEETSKAAGVSGFVLPMANLSSAGVFVGIMTSIIVVEIYRVTDKSRFKVTTLNNIPPAVARSLESLTPTLVVMLLIDSITYYLGFDWHTLVGNLVGPLVQAADSLLNVLLLVFLTTLFRFFGIHGASIVGSLARPLWLQLLEKNTAARTAGEALPRIMAEPFYQWLIWIGGAGVTTGLAILLAFRIKSEYGSKLEKAILAPSIFNINEPVIFGVPIVLNPVLMIPSTSAPIVLATIAWFATKLGLVNEVVFITPWTLPGSIGTFMATGGDWRTAVLNTVLVLVVILIYYSFFVAYDKNKLAKEQSKRTEE